MKKPLRKRKSVTGKAIAPAPVEASFAAIVGMIQAAKQRTYQAVNAELVSLYWKIGEYISHKLESAEWGDGVVEELACYLARTQPGLRGFSRQNLFRMKQFHEAYRGDEKVSALLRQLPWTHHLMIPGQSRRKEEREFYLRMAAREHWGKRELERQLRGALFERVVLNSTKISPAVRQLHPSAQSLFKDSYVVEFLNLPDGHAEADLHDGLVQLMKNYRVPWCGAIPGQRFCHSRARGNPGLFQ